MLSSVIAKSDRNTCRVQCRRKCGFFSPLDTSSKKKSELHFGTHVITRNWAKFMEGFIFQWQWTTRVRVSSIWTRDNFPFSQQPNKNQIKD